MNPITCSVVGEARNIGQVNLSFSSSPRWMNLDTEHLELCNEYYWCSRFCWCESKQHRGHRRLKYLFAETSIPRRQTAENGSRSIGTPQQSERPERLHFLSRTMQAAIIICWTIQIIPTYVTKIDRTNLLLKTLLSRSHCYGRCSIHTVGLGELCWADQASAHLRRTCRSGIPHVGMDLGTSWSLVAVYDRTTCHH